MRILCVSPHPDDSEIGMGASISMFVERGHVVTIGVCTGEGNLTMVHSGMAIPFHQREHEQREACVVLKATPSFWGIAPASRFDEVPIVKFVSVFDTEFKGFDAIYIPLPSYAEDHVIVWEAAIAAFRQGKLDGVSLFAYEQPMQQHGCRVPLGSIGRKYVPVSYGHVKNKIESINKHASQFSSRQKGVCSPDSIEALAKVRGAECGEDYAEMFYLVREKNESPV